MKIYHQEKQSIVAGSQNSVLCLELRLKEASSDDLTVRTSTLQLPEELQSETNGSEINALHYVSSRSIPINIRTLPEM